MSENKERRIEGSILTGPIPVPSTFQYKESNERFYQYGMICQKHSPFLKPDEGPFYYVTQEGSGVCKRYCTRPNCFIDMIIDPVRTMIEEDILVNLTEFKWMTNDFGFLDWIGNQQN